MQLDASLTSSISVNIMLLNPSPRSMKRLKRNFGQANEYQSSKLCEARFSECEDKNGRPSSLKASVHGKI